jgi:hypothetical protein
MRIILCYILLAFLFISCKNTPKISTRDGDNDTIIISTKPELVERIDTNGLIILVPSFSYIDLRCDTMPQSSEKDVILFAEAAFTGAPLEKEFKHSKIAGDHVSHGTRYKGYKCNRNTGAFVYYSGKWKFLYKDYSAELDRAAEKGGAAFAQEMIIHNNDIKPTVRKDGNINIFRALCNFGGRLCVIESLNAISFGQFKSSLKETGVSEAIYLDMGSGWNYSWYRINVDSIVELHPQIHDYCTNWITFYK